MTAPPTPTHRTQPGVGEAPTVSPKAAAKKITSAARSTTTVPKAVRTGAREVRLRPTARATSPSRAGSALLTAAPMTTISVICSVLGGPMSAAMVRHRIPRSG